MTSLTPGVSETAAWTSSMTWSATGQLGAVSVILMATFCSSSMLSSYIRPRS